MSELQPNSDRNSPNPPKNSAADSLANDSLADDSSDTDELKTAMLEAFGDDALKMLEEDEFSDTNPDSEPGCSQQKFNATTDANPSPRFPSLTIADHDTEKIRWVKELTRSIYASKLAPTVNQDHIADTPAPASDSPRGVLFEIGGQSFAVPLEEVQEIARCPKVTPLPHSPNWLRGVTNFRGAIVSITDLQGVLESDSNNAGNLGSNNRAKPGGEKIIVLCSLEHSINTGLVVDQILGIGLLGPCADLTSTSPAGVTKIATSTTTIDETETFLISTDRLIHWSQSVSTTTP